MFFLCSLLLLLGLGNLPPREFGPFEADVTRVVDADTLEAIVHVWPGAQMQVHVRLAKVDAPETFRPACDAERALGQRAHLQVESWLKEASGRVVLREVRLGKYAGRVVAKVEVVGLGDLGTRLIKAGLAAPDDQERPRATLCAAS